MRSNSREWWSISRGRYGGRRAIDAQGTRLGAVRTFSTQPTTVVQGNAQIAIAGQYEKGGQEQQVAGDEGRP